MPAGRPLAAITGTSSEIGATFARTLAPDHDLLLIARRLDRLKQVGRTEALYLELQSVGSNVAVQALLAN